MVGKRKILKKQRKKRFINRRAFLNSWLGSLLCQNLSTNLIKINKKFEPSSHHKLSSLTSHTKVRPSSTGKKNFKNPAKFTRILPFLGTNYWFQILQSLVLKNFPFFHNFLAYLTSRICKAVILFSRVFLAIMTVCVVSHHIKVPELFFFDCIVLLHPWI